MTDLASGIAAEILITLFFIMALVFRAQFQDPADEPTPQRRPVLALTDPSWVLRPRGSVPPVVDDVAYAAVA